MKGSKRRRSPATLAAFFPEDGSRLTLGRLLTGKPTLGRRQRVSRHFDKTASTQSSVNWPSCMSPSPSKVSRLNSIGRELTRARGAHLKPFFWDEFHRRAIGPELRRTGPFTVPPIGPDQFPVLGDFLIVFDQQASVFGCTWVVGTRPSMNGGNSPIETSYSFIGGKSPAPLGTASPS